jgi:hypothetical protein
VTSDGLKTEARQGIFALVLCFDEQRLWELLSFQLHISVFIIYRLDAYFCNIKRECAVNAPENVFERETY